MTNSSRRIAGPFNRVEGDLEVQLEITDQKVTKAWVVSPLYRGFEQILHGKPAEDSLVYVPRICGICSVAQSVAAANALATFSGVKPTINGEMATNLILANENITDHLTHFYLFFMPDFARDTYANEAWYETAAKRFKATTGTASQDVLPARAEFLHLMGLLAGKWPHSLAIQPGGTSRSIEAGEKAKILAIIYSFRKFLENILFGDTLETIANFDSEAALNEWRQEIVNKQSDFCHFLTIADALDLENLGRANDRFMSFGVYPTNQKDLLKAGVFDLATQKTHALNQTKITEDISHSWLTDQPQASHPLDGVTHPSLENEAGYTWCKAPRMDSQVVEVGALARQVVNGHPLIRDLVVKSGGNVRNRIIARLLEISIIVIEMERWAKALQPKAPFCNLAEYPDEGSGFGMMEAARGSLGHWFSVKRGVISNYQIVAPTTWNFSPRDAEQQPGALELALEGAPLRDDEINQTQRDPVSVQHIVRSFDPCMVCTVH